MDELKLTKVGDSVAVIFPEEALARLHLVAGDTAFLTEVPDGYRLTTYDPTVTGEITPSASTEGVSSSGARLGRGVT
jgi:hypothetical protein